MVEEIGAQLKSEEQPSEVLVTEPKEQVSQKAEKVSEVPDIDKLIETKQREWQSSKDKELQPLKDKIAELEKQSKESEFARQEARELEQFGDTKEVKDFQTERRRLWTDRDTFSRERNALMQEINVTREEAKAIKAHKLSIEKGIEVSKLLEAKTPEEMDYIALRIENEMLRETIIKNEPPVKVDSGVPTVTGIDFSKLSPREKIEEGLKRAQKKR